VLLESPALRLLGCKWGGDTNKAYKSEKEHIRLRQVGIFCSSSSAMKIWMLKDHGLTDELGIARIREVYVLAGGERGHEQNCAFLP
jgi:anti-sigma-K factor RskA